MPRGRVGPHRTTIKGVPIEHGQKRLMDDASSGCVVPRRRVSCDVGNVSDVSSFSRRHLSYAQHIRSGMLGTDELQLALIKIHPRLIYGNDYGVCVCISGDTFLYESSESNKKGRFSVENAML